VDVHTRWRVVIKFHTAEGSSQTEKHVGLRSMCSEDAIHVSSEVASVVLRVVKMTLVTGHAALQQRVLCNQHRVSYAKVERMY
jgi:hypothetical protein